MEEQTRFSEQNIESLTRLLRHYEENSVQLKAELQVQSNGKDALNGRISELKKENLYQIKEITRLRDAAKFDKIAAEGLVRKNGMLAHDLAACREEIQNIKDERNLYQAKVAQLEQKLNVDRSKRLQLLHENELLTQQLKHTLNLKSGNEAQFTKTQAELFLKAETLESVNALKDAQTDFITKQFEDIMQFSIESVDLKQDKFRLAESLRTKDAMIEEYGAKIRRLEEDCRELRKEVFRLRQLTNTKQSAGHCPKSRHKSDDSNPNRSRDTITSSGTVTQGSSLLTTRSRFLGSGLGLRNDDFVGYQPAGSAKSILKKVLESMD